jgi:succinoglycan biosynthesis protein ExoO
MPQLGFAVPPSTVSRVVRPRVSVIMPAYNAEATIGRALESLVQQTLSDWEAVVVDDGSADRTWAEIEIWMARDSRVRGIRLSQNEKSPSALNHAIAAACGDWIAVVDADDWIVRTRLTSLVELGEAHGCDVVTDNQVLFDAGASVPVGTVLPVTAKQNELTLDDYVAHSITGISRFDHGMLKPVVRRCFLERSGVRYQPSCHNGYDFHFMLDLLAAGARVVIDHEPSYVYVQPCGTKSGVRRRQTHYRYDLMRRHTDQAIVHHGPMLAPGALRSLRRRSRAISRFAAYIQMRDALANGALGQALSLLTRNPTCVQPACVAMFVYLGLVQRVIPLPVKLGGSH